MRDWTKVVASGVSFFGAKCSQGNTWVDPTFLAHRDGARAQPFDLCVWYHFATPGNPVEQAQRFAQLVGPLRPNERLCLDLEDDKTGQPAVDLAWADNFYTELMGRVCSDRRPFIYTSARIWEQLGNPLWSLAAEIDLWAPRYSAREPRCPRPWKTWTIWQNSDREIVPGVDGPCDGNVFAGDRAALKAFSASARQV